MGMLVTCRDICPPVLPCILPDPWPPAAGSAPIDPNQFAVICPTIPSTAICLSADLVCRVIGQNFTATCVAYLDNVAQTTTFVNTGELTFPIRPSTVPTPRTSTITVRDGGNTASGTCTFTFTAAPILTISSLIPNTAQCATPDFLVTVNGTVFTPTCVLMVDGANVTTTYVSPTQLRFMIDSSAEVVPRTAIVTVKDGATAGQGAPTFTFTAVPPLTITSLNPNTAECRSPDVLVTATGAQFTPTSVLRWDGVDVPTTYVSPTTLRFLADTSAEAVPRQAQVTVRDGATAGQGAPLFTLTAIPLPIVICPLVPASAAIGSPDLVVTVNGSNFLPTSTVLVDGNPVTTTYVSPTQLRFTAQPSTETTPRRAIVSVRNGLTAVATTTCPFDFTQVVLTPALSAIFPDMVGFSDAAKTVTYTGVNFTASSVVMRGALPLATTFVNATTLTTTTSAANAATGTFDMRVRNGTQLSNAMQAQCVLNPVLNMLVPNTAPANSAQIEVQLLGQNFGNTITVMINGVAVATRWVNGSDVRFDLTPGAAGTVQVSVRLGHQHAGSHDDVRPVAPPISLPFTFV